MAATSGVCRTNAYEVRYIQVAWSLKSQSVSGCYSDISYTVSAVGENSSSRWYYTGPVTVTLGGQTVYSLSKADRYKMYAGTLKTGTIRVYHNTSSGAGSLAASISAAIYSSSTNCTGSNSWTLPTIPRVSSFSISPTSQACGGNVKITISPKSTAFKHILYYKYGSASYTKITEVAAASTTATWTIPTSLADAFTSATSFSVTILCETYNGSTLIGSKTGTLTVTIPDSYKVTISSVALSDVGQSFFSLPSNTFVRMLSKIKATYTTDSGSAHGATVSQYLTTVEGQSTSGNNATTKALTKAGTEPVTCKITDTRKRTDTLETSITVIDYNYPAVSLSVLQAPTGLTTGKITCTFSGKVYPVNDGTEDKNTKTLTVYYKKSSDSSWTQAGTVSLSAFEFSDVTHEISDIDPDSTYEVKAELADKVTTTTVTQTTGIICISRLSGGKGVTLFQEATQEGFWIKDMRYSLTDEEYEALSSLLGG